MQTVNFNQFRIGDVFSFKRCFVQKDIDIFAEASGDHNPLHINQDYAISSSFGKIVIPLQLLLTPCSAIAGMVFPGKSSLFLSSSAQSFLPAFPNDELTYSAKIDAINYPQRVLTIKVLILRKEDILVEVILRTQAREEVWEQDVLQKTISTTQPARALITGSSGELGFALAHNLVRKGWNLLLQDRGNITRRNEILKALEPFNRDVRFLCADFSIEAEQDSFIQQMLEYEDISILFHAASSGMKSPIHELVQTNYNALQKLGQAIIPSFLAQQHGVIAFVASTSMEQSLQGFEDYAAVKAMGVNYVNSLERKYAPYGIRGLVFSPARIDTKFSQILNKLGGQAMLPAHAAEEATSFILTPPLGNNCLWLEKNDQKIGRIGFSSKVAQSPTSVTPQNNVNTSFSTTQEKNSKQPTLEIENLLETALRETLKLDASVSLVESGLGVTPGWDSLRHIELILHLESMYPFHFTAEEIQATTNFQSLLNLLILKQKK